MFYQIKAVRKKPVSSCCGDELSYGFCPLHWNDHHSISLWWFKHSWQDSLGAWDEFSSVHRVSAYHRDGHLCSPCLFPRKEQAAFALNPHTYKNLRSRAVWDYDTSERLLCGAGSHITDGGERLEQCHSGSHFPSRSRLEVRIRSATGWAKLIGTISCISGALIFTFWKGPLFRSFVKRPLIVVYDHGKVHGKENWIQGSLLILASQIAFSAWLILQAKVYDAYPARLSMNALICFCASFQSLALALIFEKNTSSWQLGWNIQLVAIIYCGTVISCLSYYLQTYCISERGPVFAAMFTPLLLVIVGIFSALFFAERLHVGSLIGALIIIAGLYCVLWGKNKECGRNGDKRRDVESTTLTAVLPVSTSNNDTKLTPQERTI